MHNQDSAQTISNILQDGGLATEVKEVDIKSKPDLVEDSSSKTAPVDERSTVLETIESTTVDSETVLSDIPRPDLSESGEALGVDLSLPPGTIVSHLEALARENWLLEESTLPEIEASELDILNAIIKSLREKNANISAETDALRAQNSVLEGQLVDFDRGVAELSELKSVREHLGDRVLLDQARLKIVREGGCRSWEELRDSFDSIEALKRHLIERFSLSDNAVSLICGTDDICREGDDVASEEDIRFAISQQSIESFRKKLERVFSFCYGEDV